MSMEGHDELLQKTRKLIRLRRSVRLIDVSNLENEDFLIEELRKQGKIDKLFTEIKELMRAEPVVEAYQPRVRETLMEIRDENEPPGTQNDVWFYIIGTCLESEQLAKKVSSLYPKLPGFARFKNEYFQTDCDKVYQERFEKASREVEEVGEPGLYLDVRDVAAQLVMEGREPEAAVDEVRDYIDNYRFREVVATKRSLVLLPIVSRRVPAFLNSRPKDPNRQK
ncbi:MAG: hypothetical protein ACE5JX_19265 [Acidobacteriota bacterium]